MRQCSLVAALELLDGLPALASRRFAWLADEGILGQITTVLLEASRLLAILALETGDIGLARWAISKGRILLPTDDELSALDVRLSEASRAEESPLAL